MFSPEEQEQAQLGQAMAKSAMVAIVGVLMVLLAHMPDRSSDGLLVRHFGEEGAVLATRLIGLGVAALGSLWFSSSLRKLKELRPRKPEARRDPMDLE